MPPLPKDRVIKSRPFQNVGCDFMGPFTSKTLEKMYVCLYACLTTRAVHLEVVENLSAGAFLNCFVRFVSRRGVPEIVRSDCGTNFKLGEVIITKMFCDLNENGRSLMSYCASQRINWIFNPPGSPWMGGAWERLIGLTKKAFNKSIGRKRLSFADMCTVITRIEAILNTRPLTKVNSSDIAEIPLRLIDFLKGNFNYSLPSTGDKAEPVPPLPKNGTRGRMWKVVVLATIFCFAPPKERSHPRSGHTRSKHSRQPSTPSSSSTSQQAIISAPAPSRILKTP
ncbi:hypothetical protein RB195_013950 [Necator americanus]|uniref:Integrase catalytic domain-containing protein n=1 Tax=Necator americanus TaxID=51031 RepID=A0ABR1DXX5_NECAM